MTSLRKLSHEQIVLRQVGRSRQPRIPLTLVLDNIRSLLNVGSIFRIADGLGVEHVWLCGITGYPPQGGISKTALGAEESVAWTHHRDIICVIKDLKKRGYVIVSLEQVEGAIACEEYIPGQRPVALVVGNEIDGVSDDVLALSDVAIEIPMQGVKNSLNVGVACGIAVSHIRRAILRRDSE